MCFRGLLFTRDGHSSARKVESQALRVQHTTLTRQSRKQAEGWTGVHVSRLATY